MLMSYENPIILDLYCGAGGAGKGYYDAGFQVIGVDINDQPRYPYQFIKYCAKQFLQDYDLSIFSAIHASPPCQLYSVLNYVLKRTDYPDDVKPIRSLLLQTELPYVIENVMNAPMKNPIMLCGSMFNLGVLRHRLFESNFPLIAPIHKSHHKQKDYARDFVPVYGNGFKSKEARQAMGIDWMVKDEIAEAIPPAYTEYIGKQLLAYIRQRDKVDLLGRALLSNI